MMTRLDTYDPPPAHEDALLTETPNVDGTFNPAADKDVSRGQQEGLNSALSAAFVAVPAPQVLPSVC
jgi:hypothetical protein